MPYLQEQSDGSFSIQPKQNIVRQSIVLNNGKDWDPAKCQARFAHEVDDGSAHWTYDSNGCLLYTSPSPRDATLSRMPSSA